MQFHRPLVNTEIGGDLLVESSLHDRREHFELPLAEGVEAREQLILTGARLAFMRVAGQGARHCVDQLFFRRSLFQEILGTSAHRLYGRRNVAMPSEEEDRHWIGCLRERRL